MKVLLFSPSVSSHTQNWVIGLKKKGIDVCVVTFAEHFSEENARLVETHVLPKFAPGKLSYFMSVFAFRKLIKKLNPDIVHAHYASSYGFIAGLSKIKPLVLSTWGSDVYLFPKNVLNRFILKKALSKADVICATSYALKRETQKYTNKEVEVIPFGVDVELFKPQDSQYEKNNFTFGIVKSLKDVYGYPKLFQAFSILVNENKNVRLVVVGDGTEGKRYRKIVKELQIEKYVDFVGFVPNEVVPEYMRIFDVVVLPSESESFGVAAIEAQACGIPVIVNNVGGLPEVLIDNETGIIIPNNDPRTIYCAMKEIIDNQERLIKMKEKAPIFVRDNYSWDMCLQKMIDTYNRK